MLSMCENFLFILQLHKIDLIHALALLIMQIFFSPQSLLAIIMVSLVAALNTTDVPPCAVEFSSIQNSDSHVLTSTHSEDPCLQASILPAAGLQTLLAFAKTKRS